MRMDNDIVPELLADIQKQFYLETTQSKKLKAALLKLEKNKATYQDVNEFAIEVGETLSKVLSDNIYSEILPDQKMYYNIAQRILEPTLKNNYDLISGYAADVQKSLNQAANLNLKAQVPEYNQDRTNGIINRVSSEENFDDIKWILDDPIVNLSQSVVDDSIRENSEFQAKAGLRPKLIRRVSGHGCAWCRNLSGSYDYGDAPEDIYRRHDNCRCTVDFQPSSGRRQNVWSKKWYKSQNDAKIEVRKNIGVLVESGAKNYARDESTDFLFSKEHVRRQKYAFTQYDEIKNSDQNLEKRKIYSNIRKYKSMSDFSKRDVDIAFDHVFNDIHDLENGKGLFTPDPDMAYSWTRLINDESIREHDLILLRHERCERDYMKKGMDYHKAHVETDSKFDYAGALKKYKEGRK